MRTFELAYDAYAEFQRNMERYWCLRYLQQEAIAMAKATVIRENLVRFNDLPLVVRVNGMPVLPSGSDVELEIDAIDFFDREVVCRLRQNG